MLVRKPDDEGFGLVEMVIAFFLLGLIAVAMLPALYNGIAFATTQSSTATATRALNAQIEALRENPSCDALKLAVSPGVTVNDGRGDPIALKGTVTPVCDPNTHLQAVTIALSATQHGRQLATTTAKIYLP